MNLELNSAEAEDLREALHAFTQRLLTELAHTDQRQYREALREKLRRFEWLDEKLEAHQQPAEGARFAP